MAEQRSIEDRERLYRIQDLDARNPATWSAEDALFHLEWTFDAAVRQHPDAMERYLPRLDGVTDPIERRNIMRYALSQTIGERYR